MFLVFADPASQWTMRKSRYFDWGQRWMIACSATESTSIQEVMIAAALGKQISEEEGNYSLIPSSTNVAGRLGQL